jgi:hypothetical protein
MIAMRGFLAVLMLAGALGTAVAEPVRTIAIEVQPYYAAAGGVGERPRVAVGDSVSARLASTRAEDILAVRDEIAAKPDVITPMTLMVLSIRLYDIGRRDEAVKWFYAAKTRYLVLAAVIDMEAAGLSQVTDAVRNFAYLAGPAINGYAFCDLARQQAAHMAALDWVEQNPYAAMFMTRLPARPGERAANVKRALAQARENAGKERAWFAERKNAAEFFATRRANGTDEKFCWGT